MFQEKRSVFNHRVGTSRNTVRNGASDSLKRTYKTVSNGATHWKVKLAPTYHRTIIHSFTVTFGLNPGLRGKNLISMKIPCDLAGLRPVLGVSANKEFRYPVVKVLLRWMHAVLRIASRQ
ncbi:hypothetical protein D918_04178 [Trichuris suis]|nr:hypothetical protein D918_04178 [Trichuris suis]